ncbi:MAG TPA: phage tail tape measure protein [Rhizobiaceae bacterium]|nr:phage tail tape measure protein [Rhizobiaceae bacterium]
MADDVTVRINADTTQFAEALNGLGDLAERFGGQLTGALRGAVVSGRSLEDVLRRLALNLASMALEQGLSPLRNLFSGLLGSLSGGLGKILPFAQGGVVPFAAGGVVAAPSYFPMGGGNVGLMGEAGPEAIMPLQRGADGRLGVAAGGGAAGVTVVFNVSTPDAASFRKSEAQLSGMLARAVSRGTRTL